MEQELIKAIKRAFSSGDYPGDANLIKEIQSPESYDMYEAFKGKDWREIDVEMAGHWRMNLLRFTDAAFHYFLPAFLIASVGKDPFELEDFIVFRLTPPDDKSEVEQFRTKMSLFDDKQKSAIYKILQYFASYADEDEPDYIQDVLAFWNPDAD